jgi:hypothetical protein
MKNLTMDSYSEIRRVRKAMSDSAGHDVHKLAAMFNERRNQVVDRIIDPGTKAEQCDATEPSKKRSSNGQSSPAAR